MTFEEEDSEIEEESSVDEPKVEEGEEVEETSDEKSDEKKAKKEEVKEPEEIESVPLNQNPNRRKSSGLGLTLGIGPSIVLRRMTLSGSSRDISHVPNLYIGGVFAIGLKLYSNRSFGHLLLEAEGGFGSAQNAEIDFQAGRNLVTENAFFSFYLVNEKPLSSALDLRFLLGVGALSFTVEPNARYTGHRYITVDIGSEIKWWVSSTFNAGLGLAIRPSFFTDQSSDADGEGSGFGARLRSHLEYRIRAPKEKDLSNALDIRLQVEAEFFQSSFPLSGRVGADPISSDQHYMSVVSLRYHL